MATQEQKLQLVVAARRTPHPALRATLSLRERAGARGFLAHLMRRAEARHLPP
jgi:hypothetical protein